MANVKLETDASGNVLVIATLDAGRAREIATNAKAMCEKDQAATLQCAQREWIAEALNVLNDAHTALQKTDAQIDTEQAAEIARITARGAALKQRPEVAKEVAELVKPEAKP